MTCNCIDFALGDYVQSRLNPQVFGIVVGDSNFGQFVNVQLSVSLEIQAFHAVTLQHMQPAEPEPPTKAEDEPESNVIFVDFTAPRKLKITTRTAGRA